MCSPFGISKTPCFPPPFEAVVTTSATDAIPLEASAAGVAETAFAISNCTYYNNANHSHVVLHDLTAGFGGDLLRAHRDAAHGDAANRGR